MPDSSSQHPEISPASLRLGLDIGTNSIGWALVHLDNSGEMPKPDKLVRAGVRIFGEGRDEKTLTTLNASRREHRLASRNRDRFLRRQKSLINRLVHFKFFPADEDERKKLAELNPYKCRAEALEKKLPLEQIGRAFFHLNQRRGFKSNRISDRGDSESGIVNQSIEKFREALKENDCKTAGQLLWQWHQKKRPIRGRRRGTSSKDLYEIYLNRKIIEEEFEAIWNKQAEFHLNQMTEEARESIHHAIFFQRKLKDPIVGDCQFLEEEKRAPWSLPVAQQFRIYQELNNLSWNDGDKTVYLRDYQGSQELRDHLFKILNSRKDMTFDSMRKELSKAGVDNISKFNLESEVRKKIDGNKTAALMKGKKGIGDIWEQLSANEQQLLIELLEDSSLEDDKVKELLIQNWGLTDEQADKCLKMNLPDSHCMLSLKAIKMILPHLRDGLYYYDACQQAGLQNREYSGGLVQQLPYYGKILLGSTILFRKPEQFTEEKKKRFPELTHGRIPNPTVHIAMGQIQLLVNELIRDYGHPQQIVIEVGRELPLGPDGRREEEKAMKENLERNEKYKRQIEEAGVAINRDNILRLRLWDELGDSQNGIRECPYCGKKISRHILFSDQVQIEHILPYSITLDDGFNNKTLSCRQCNLDKGNREPYAAFGHTPQWGEIWMRVANLDWRKRKRFEENALETWKNNEEEFLDRQLNDMRYITRTTQRYLGAVCEDIWGIPGHLTSMVRRELGLLGLHKEPRDSSSVEGDKKPQQIKDRTDHRNHTIDAIAVAMCDRSLLQRIATDFNRRREQRINKPGIKDRITPPWEGFRNDVQQELYSLTVSHRVSMKKEGQLHKETAYGMIEENENGTAEVVTRKSISELTKTKDLQAIRNPVLRTELLNCVECFDDGSADFKSAVETYCKNKQIRRVRVKDTLTVIPVVDRKNGKPYKYYTTRSNWCMDIYIDPKGKWRGECITRYDVASKKKGKKEYIPQWQRNHPTAKKVMRLFINNLLQFSEGSRFGKTIMRVQKLSGQEIALAPHSEANVDKRHSDSHDPFKMARISPGVLQKEGAKLIHISPSGKIMPAKYFTSTADGEDC